MNELPVLPRGWTWTSLGEVATSIRNGVFVSRPASEPPGARILRISAVRPNTLDIDEVRYANPMPPGAERYFVNSGDLLVTRYSGNPAYVGSCAVVQKVPAPTLHPDKLIRVVLDRRIANPSFVQFALNGGFVRRQVEQRHRTTAGQVGISGSQLRTVPVPLAPLCEQVRIVAAIEQYLSRLETADGTLASAVNRLHALERRLVDESLEGPEVPLGELIREPLRNGISAPASAIGQIRVVTLTAVTKAEFIEENTKIVDLGARPVDDFWMEPGDVFIQRSNTPELVGSAALYRGPQRWAIFPDLLIRVRAGDRLDPGYLELALRSRRLRRYFQQSAQGIAGSMPKISQPTVEAARIPLPASRARQQMIVAATTRRLEILDRVAAEVRQAQQHRRKVWQSILAAAFAGKLVPHDPEGEPASVPLKRTQTEGTSAMAARRLRRPKG